MATASRTCSGHSSFQRQAHEVGGARDAELGLDQIGLAFKVSSAAGTIVALGVLAHDLLDGANTVMLSLSGGAGDRAARRWLLADAIAPAAGIVLSSRLYVPAAPLAIGLAVFAGLFLNIGASELLPLAHTRRPLPSTTFASLVGMGLIYAAVRLAD